MTRLSICQYRYGFDPDIEETLPVVDTVSSIAPSSHAGEHRNHTPRKQLISDDGQLRLEPPVKSMNSCQCVSNVAINCHQPGESPRFNSARACAKAKSNLERTVSKSVRYRLRSDCKLASGRGSDTDKNSDRVSSKNR